MERSVWLHFKQMLQRIQSSPSLSSENRTVQNINSASSSSPDRSWASSESRSSTDISSCLSQSLFLKWLHVSIGQGVATNDATFFACWVPDGFFLFAHNCSFSRNLLVASVVTQYFLVRRASDDLSMLTLGAGALRFWSYRRQRADTASRIGVKIWADAGTASNSLDILSRSSPIVKDAEFLLRPVSPERKSWCRKMFLLQG